MVHFKLAWGLRKAMSCHGDLMADMIAQLVDCHGMSGGARPATAPVMEIRCLLGELGYVAAMAGSSSAPEQ